MKYKRKTTDVEAIQFTGTNSYDIQEWLDVCFGIGKYSIADDWQGYCIYKNSTKNTVMKIAKSNYLVKTGNTFAILTSDIFHTMFEYNDIGAKDGN